MVASGAASAPTAYERAPNESLVWGAWAKVKDGAEQAWQTCSTLLDDDNEDQFFDVHIVVECDGCGRKPLRVRYTCGIEDFDLCEACATKEPSRTYERVERPPAELNTMTLLTAYRHGVFPWPDAADGELMWYSPAMRAVLRFAKLRVGKTLRQARRKSRLRFTIDHAFDAVLAHCASTPRANQQGTWLGTEMRDAYSALHAAGHAHSVEAWQGQRLVGGLYGVDCGGCFSGESMFHIVPEASRLALLHLVDHLQAVLVFGHSIPAILDNAPEC